LEIAKVLIAHENDKGAANTIRRRNLAGPLRSLVLTAVCGLDNDPVPEDDERSKASIARSAPADFYPRVQRGIGDIALDFTEACIVAAYGHTPYEKRPYIVKGYGADSAAYLAGPWTMVTIYRLSVWHVALLDPEVRATHKYLHSKRQSKANGGIHAAFPEELQLKCLPKGTPAGQALWRVDLADACLRSLVSRGLLLDQYALCGPLSTEAAMQAWLERAPALVAQDEAARLAKRQAKKERWAAAGAAPPPAQGANPARRKLQPPL
jgi:hypothetical protein